LARVQSARQNPRGARQLFQEADFDCIAEWGFDFVRLPLAYRNWAPQPGRIIEAVLPEIDQAVTWGQARGILVDICLHHALGPPPADVLSLWIDGSDGGEALRAQGQEHA
jgi:endoglucanase